MTDASFTLITPERFKRLRIALAIGIVVFVLLFLLLSNRIVYYIDPGERGVRWSPFGGTVLHRDYGEGLRLLAPWDVLYLYNVRVQEAHDTVTLLTGNGLPMTVGYSCRYRPDLRKLPQLHETYGPNYAEIMVKPEIASALREIIGNYRPEEIYARDEEGLLREINDSLASEMVNRYVTIETLVLTQLRVTPELEKAINDKLVDEQQALVYEFRLQREISESLRKSIEAAGIQTFEKTSGVSILTWRGVDAAIGLATSPNSKVVVVGSGPEGLPVILSGEH